MLLFCITKSHQELLGISSKIASSIFLPAFTEGPEEANLFIRVVFNLE